MSIQGFLLVFAAAVMTMAGNLLMRAGISRAAGFSPSGALDALMRFTKLLLEPRFASGFVIYFLAALVWFRIISSEPLSIAYPVLVGLTFVLVTFGAVVAFGETMSLQKAIGLAVILSGILIASTSRAALLS